MRSISSSDVLSGDTRPLIFRKRLCALLRIILEFYGSDLIVTVAVLLTSTL